MYNNELRHYGILGMQWGKRRAQSPVGSQNNNRTRVEDKPTNPYTKAVHKNTLAAVNRVSQMGLSIGLTRAASAVATARGKKATAGVLNAIGNMAAVGFGTALVVDFARNKTD